MTLLLSLQGISDLLHQNTFLALLGVPLLLIAADVLTGVASACARGVFSLKQFAQFLQTSIVPYAAVILVTLLLYLAVGSQVASSVSAFLGMGWLSLSTVGSIAQNLKELGASQQVLSEVQQVGNELVQMGGGSTGQSAPALAPTQSIGGYPIVQPQQTWPTATTTNTYTLSMPANVPQPPVEPVRTSTPPPVTMTATAVAPAPAVSQQPTTPIAAVSPAPPAGQPTAPVVQMPSGF